MNGIKLPIDFNMIRVKFNEIHPDATNLRTQRDPDADRRFEGMVERHGLLNWFWIAKRGGNGYRLAKGHRRHEVCLKHKLDERNPVVQCILIFPRDDPDRLFTDQEIRKIRLLDEAGQLKVTEFDFLVAVAEYAEEEKAKDRSLESIATEDFGHGQPWLSQIINALMNPTTHNGLRDGFITLHLANYLVNLPVDAQETLIEAKKKVGTENTKRLIKLVRNGKEIPSKDASKEEILEFLNEVKTPQEAEEEDEDGDDGDDEGGESKPKNIAPFVNKVYRICEKAVAFAENDNFEVPKGKRLDTLLENLHNVREEQDKFEEAIFQRISGITFEERAVIRLAEETKRLKHLAHNISEDGLGSWDNAVNDIVNSVKEAKHIRNNRFAKNHHQADAKRGG